MRTPRHLILTTFLLATFAFAQGEAERSETITKPSEDGDITGVVSGVLDGAPFTVYSYLLQAGEPELTNTAYWEDWRNLGIGISVDVSAHKGASVGISAWEGAFSLEFDLSDDLELMDYGDVPDITYFESLLNGYRMSEGYLELTEVAWVDDETLRIEGHFEGTFSSIMGEGNNQIAGEFAIEWVSLQRLPF